MRVSSPLLILIVNLLIFSYRFNRGGMKKGWESRGYLGILHSNANKHYTKE